MALLSSNMLPLNTKAPQFKLKDTISNKEMDLEAVKGKIATVIMFISNHCPYVKHINLELANLANNYKNKAVGFVAISSNDISKYPEDAPDLMKKNASKYGFNFPYLYDESQDVAKRYAAACTPDFYVFDTALKLVYRGQFDDSRPGNHIPVTGRNIREALDALLSGIKIKADQQPSIGCSIKWK